MIKILLLGHKGMLGHMVKKYFISISNIKIIIIEDRYPSIGFKENIKNIKCDYIINCIGAIPQRTTDFSINYELPIWLEENTTSKIIHPGTDCEMDNDEYGLSKAKASKYLIENGKRTKILKTSIIGPELNTKASLLEWFLDQEGEVFGYTKAMWNGNTTLQWAKQCFHLIENWDNYKVLTILEGECISKYNMLNIIKEIFKKDIKILPKELGKNKLLKGDIITPNFRQQILELKNYYYA
tara:strand:+ start:14 stop:733 length:720 start_codon:yes stop_codon:yes gene_type:complete